MRSFAKVLSRLHGRPLTVVIMLMSSIVIAASDPNTAVREEFLQATAAVKVGSLAASDSNALQAYILYPYLQAARLQLALIQKTRDAVTLDQSIGDFLLAQGTAPVVRNLRRAWLLDLAARQEWAQFLANLPASAGDAEQRCLAVTAQLSVVSGNTNAATMVDLLGGSLTSLWLNANRQPSACNPPFEWARANNIITVELIEQRARLALKSGNAALARELADMLPRDRAEPLRQWALLIEKPQQAIDALIARPHIKVESAALQDGWLRLARNDQDAALHRWSRLLRARGLDKTTGSPYALSLALALSWSRRDEALQYFARVVPADMTEQAHEWRVRAALWATDWRTVRQGIAAMPETLRAQARWRYWLARANEQLKDADAARALYEELVTRDDNYYAAMAAARLGADYAPHPQPLPENVAAMQTLSRLPAMQRVRELLAVQLRSEAEAEWSQIFATLQPGEHLAAAQLAHEWAWHDQAVATAARLGLYYDYQFLYPQPYDPEVNAAVKLSGLTADLIYGVMRQETLFRPDAQSAANARGLLQLLPDTARIVARKNNLPIPGEDDLFNPAVNVPLGAVYLKSLVDSFDGQVVLALASYNAGPNAARRWLPANAMESDVWMENIPYNETRNYVQRVLWHSLVFHWLRTDKPLDTRAWLAKVQP
jgi:peptidoglycan lytic transglycosylase